MNSPSIQEIRSNFSQYIQRAQQGEVIVITKRGHQVAVLLSLEEYQRLISPKKNLFEAISQFRQDYPFDDEGHYEEPSIDSILAEVRTAETAREFDLD